MSELKARRIGQLMSETGRCDTEVYIKSEVDAVLAENRRLKKKINEAQTELELWRDGSIISEAHQQELDGKRHSDYKLCLAMAQWCEEHYRYLTCLENWQMTDKEYRQVIGDYWERWQKRLLKLAEKFKEAK